MDGFSHLQTDRVQDTSYMFGTKNIVPDDLTLDVNKLMV